MYFGGIGMEWGPKNKTKHCLHGDQTKRAVWLPIRLLVDVPVRMRPETTGQCGEVLAGHLINEATQGENTLAAINCSLLITCMCQDVQQIFFGRQQIFLEDVCLLTCRRWRWWGWSRAWCRPAGAWWARAGSGWRGWGRRVSSAQTGSFRTRGTRAARGSPASRTSRAPPPPPSAGRTGPSCLQTETSLFH